MVFTCYDLIDISIAAAIEKHPQWRYNPDVMCGLREYCDNNIEQFCKSDGYIVRANVNDNGDCEVLLISDNSDQPLRCWVIQNVVSISTGQGI